MLKPQEEQQAACSFQAVAAHMASLPSELYEPASSVGTSRAFQVEVRLAGRAAVLLKKVAMQPFVLNLFVSVSACLFGLPFVRSSV